MEDIEKNKKENDVLFNSIEASKNEKSMDPSVNKVNGDMIFSIPDDDDNSDGGHSYDNDKQGHKNNHIDVDESGMSSVDDDSTYNSKVRNRSSSSLSSHSVLIKITRLMTKSSYALTIFMVCSLVCSAIFFVFVFMTILAMSPGINTDFVSVEDLKRAAIGVGDVTRQSMTMFDTAGQAFVDQLRMEYIRRKTYWDEKQQQLTSSSSSSSSTEYGDIEDDQEAIEWRYGPHHTLKDFKPEDALPPVCPMLEDHLEITFDLSDPSFDVYGYPCVMEMHWSVEMEMDEIQKDEEDFIKYRHFSSSDPSRGFSPGLSSSKTTGSKTFSVGRTNEMPFKNIHCKRKYKMSGFTPWKCTPSKRLPSKYSMVYSVGCIDVDSGGDVNVKSTESPYSNGKYKQKQLEGDAKVDIDPEKTATHSNDKNKPYESFEFIDMNEQDPYRINPAYDKNFQRLEQGHYCHINYAITKNGTWETLKDRPKYSLYLLCFCFFLSICFFSTSKSTIIFSSVTLVLQVIMYALILFYFDVKPYISFGLASTLGILSFAFSIGASASLVLLSIFELLTKVKFHCGEGNIFRGPKPLLFLLLDKIIQSCSQGHFADEYEHQSLADYHSHDVMMDHLHDSNQFREVETVVDHHHPMTDEARVLRPGDKEYNRTVPMNSAPDRYWTGGGVGRKTLVSAIHSNDDTTTTAAAAASGSEIYHVESIPDIYKES